ncbi:DUF116 domain-containing protein [Veillonella rodentium]|uniref:Protein of uncharacterized function DUF116 n=1 Tax=Veillonella rodentium TaxID=248315 RepID=A0A239YYG9_9FIRM|nr:DUF116 domain-containing protein [Veillonella rodentium]SNV63965.1 Protein of uncharacterised function DUF116 [Veillonella rodentium]
METKSKQYETFPLYLVLSTLTCAILTGFLSFLMYLLWPGLLKLHSMAPLIICVILVLIICIIWFLCVSLIVASTGIVKLHPVILRLANRFIYGLFPLSLTLGKLRGITKDRLRQSMIDLINHLVTLDMYTVESERILLLTPHCLQESSCVHKITHDVNNCKQCGRCQVGDLLQIARDYGCRFIVVTGGTLARLKVEEARPKAIVAIACERDLASGMADVFPIPVIGVLNERPNGPCCNTKVDSERVRTVVEQLIGRNNHDIS